MASPTPGMLLKLLQSMSSPKKQFSDHRSPILQITAILPATSDLFTSSNYFYLQLSDSLNSTYVSVSSSDHNPDTLHLGQMVHLDRLIPSHPLPLVSNLRPISFLGRSPPPICGSPAPLTALSSPSDPTNFVIQPSSPDSAPPVMSAASAAPTVKENPTITVKRRFSSPTVAKRRDPSPLVAGKRSSSPVPSKCVVPSLVTAKEENRRVAKEAAIVVPSRYRQASPARRSSVSPMSRRVSGSGGEGSLGKKKVGVVGSGKGAGRKSWEGEEKSAVKVKAVDQRAVLRTQEIPLIVQELKKMDKESEVVISQRLSDASSKEQLNMEESSPKLEKKTVKTIESSPKEKGKGNEKKQKHNHTSPKITVHDRKWTDGSIPLDTVSDTLARLGKEALQRRNSASAAAAEALEEALATETIIRSLTKFADLSSSFKAENPLPIIDAFLSIYKDASKSIPTSSEEQTQPDGSKPASVWVDAALSTDLEITALVHDLGIGDSKFITNTKSSNVSSRKNGGWTRGSGSENVGLGKALRREMQGWFMRFVESVLDCGFGLFGEGEGRDNGRVAAVLSQLKRVNEWLDEVGRRKDDEVVEKIERLKRKIYGFVITHVGSAFDTSVSLNK